MSNIFIIESLIVTVENGIGSVKLNVVDLISEDIAFLDFFNR